MSTSSTRKGVRLTLPGAPNHPHRVHGLNVLVSPSEATLLDDEQLARAEEMIAGGADLELVDVEVDKDGAPAGALVVAPWDGYPDETAKTVIARIAEGDTELAGAVIAFERQQSNPRRTVLDAAAARISELEG